MNTKDSNLQIALCTLATLFVLWLILGGCSGEARSAPPPPPAAAIVAKAVPERMANEDRLRLELAKAKLDAAQAGWKSAVEFVGIKYRLAAEDQFNVESGEIFRKPPAPVEAKDAGSP